MDAEGEVFDIVDEDDIVIGRATRAECNSDPRLIHRASFVLIRDDEGQMLWQKRSASKDTAPGEWTLSACGHVDCGESYEEAAVREVREELGVGVVVRFVQKYLLRYTNENEWSAIFEAESEGPFDVDHEEVDEVRFMLIEEAFRRESEGDMVIAGIGSQDPGKIGGVIRSEYAWIEGTRVTSQRWIRETRSVL